MRLLAREAMGRRQEAEREAAEAQRARAAAEREERRAAFLATAGQELASSLDYEHAIATLARLIVPNIADICVIDLAEPDGALRRAAVAHRDAEREHELETRVGEVIRDVPEALALVIRERESRIIGYASSLLQYAGVAAGGAALADGGAAGQPRADARRDPRPRRRRERSSRRRTRRWSASCRATDRWRSTTRGCIASRSRPCRRARKCWPSSRTTSAIR